MSALQRRSFALRYRASLVQLGAEVFDYYFAKVKRENADPRRNGVQVE